MPFSDVKDLPQNIRVRICQCQSTFGGRMIIFSDSFLQPEQEKLLENFGRIATQAVLVESDHSNLAEAMDLLIEHMGEMIITGNGDSAIFMGGFAPSAIHMYRSFAAAHGIIFINPVYDENTARKMSSVETPCLVITSTPGNLDHDPDAVKYHDFIANSRIQYIRGVEGNPLFQRFTQSFNSIQRFLQDD